MGTCSTCGKITTTKGEKGDKGDTGATGPQGPQGPSGGAHENYYVLGNNSYVYNGGSGLQVVVGATDATNQDIYYSGLVYVRAIAADTVTITPFGAGTHQAEIKSDLPALRGGETYTYSTIPFCGKMTIDTNLTNFGFNIACTSGLSEVELMQGNINFTRE